MTNLLNLTHTTRQSRPLQPEPREADDCPPCCRSQKASRRVLFAREPPVPAIAEKSQQQMPFAKSSVTLTG
jgi:hypothetical protein